MGTRSTSRPICAIAIALSGASCARAPATAKTVDVEQERLLCDVLAPDDVIAHLPDRYPHASAAEMRGTCGLDVEGQCSLCERELVWRDSHRRNVARLASERAARGGTPPTTSSDDLGAKIAVGAVGVVGVAVIVVMMGQGRTP